MNPSECKEILTFALPLRFLYAVSYRETLCVCGEIVSKPFNRHCAARCRIAKRYVCALKSFLAVGNTALSSVRTIRREPCLIAKRFVCAVKSWLGLLAPIEMRGAGRQTLRVCVQIVSAVTGNDDSHIRTLQRPPNATHAVVFAFPMPLRETL